jgi:hypothetical protein
MKTNFVKFNACLKVLPKTIGGNMAKKRFFGTVLRTVGMLGMVPVFEMVFSGCDGGGDINTVKEFL